MSRNEKFWFLIGPSMLSFVMAATSPMIQIYFYQLIDSRTIAIATLLGTLIRAMTNWSITLQSIKTFYKKNFLWIVLIDVIAFAIISFSGYDYPEIRFIGFGILSATSSCLWLMIMGNAVNCVIKDGDKRTDFDAISETSSLISCTLGSGVSILFNTIDVEYCIIAQCCAMLFCGMTDLYGFHKIKNNHNIGIE